MKKKIYVFILLIVTLSVSVLFFTSCNKEVTVTIHRENPFSSHAETVKMTKTLGETIAFTEFKEKIISHEILQDGGGTEFGFYTDKECTVKYDEDTPLTKNITLYTDKKAITSSTSAYAMIYFIYNNKEYPVFKYTGDKLTATDFTISAYGKPIDANSLEFYFDEEMTTKLDLTDLKVSSLFEENECHDRKPIYVKNTAE